MLKNQKQNDYQKAGMAAYQLYQQQQQQAQYQPPQEVGAGINATNIELPSQTDQTPDYLLSFETLLARAEAGNASAQFLVSLDLRNGFLGGVINMEEGEKWLKKASQNSSNSPAVLCAKGLCYERALAGVSIKNPALARQHYASAAEQGYVPAMLHLASALYDEAITQTTTTVQYHTAVHQHRDEAKLQDVIRFLTTAAEAKYPPAYHFLADCYLRGHGVQKDQAEGFRLLKHAQAEGKSTAYSKMRLGDCYMYSWGSAKQSTAEAKKWYRKARDQGFDIGDRRVSSSCCTIS